MSRASDTSGPTVIVSRRVTPSRRNDFAVWHHRLLDTASMFPGFIGAESQPPDDVHPGEWITRFRFATTAELESWMDSAERAALLAEAESLLDGPVREQRIARPSPVSSLVTAVISKRLRPDATADYARIQDEIDATMARFPGFVRSSVSEPVEGVQDDHVTVVMFDSKENLDRWMRSPERREALSSLERLIEGDQEITILGSFGGWFEDSPDAPTKRWKQAVSVLLALYPTVVVLTLLQDVIAPDAPMLIALFVSNVASVSILTWLLMPKVTELLAAWLSR